jgi:hypothetical protein
VGWGRVVTGLLTGAVGLVKDPGMVMVRAVTGFMSGMGDVTGDGIDVEVGVVGSGMVVSGIDSVTPHRGMMVLIKITSKDSR